MIENCPDERKAVTVIKISTAISANNLFFMLIDLFSRYVILLIHYTIRSIEVVWYGITLFYYQNFASSSAASSL